VRLLLDGSTTVVDATATNGHAAPPLEPAAAFALQRERDDAVARCRALEAEVSALRARLGVA